MDQERVSRRAIGDAGEREAEQYLVKLGAEMLRRNYTCRGGEIDLVARHEGVLLFVEVKLRATNRFGTPGEAVNWTKRRRVCKAALHYIGHTGEMDAPMRFDVIEITPGGVKHIPGAFDYIE